MGTVIQSLTLLSDQIFLCYGVATKNIKNGELSISEKYRL